MATCTAMYAIPAHRTTDARRATTDLRVVIAGPIGTPPESPVTRHCSGESVGRMNPMIGRGAEAHVHHLSCPSWPARKVALTLTLIRAIIFTYVREMRLRRHPESASYGDFSNIAPILAVSPGTCSNRSRSAAENRLPTPT